MNNNDIFHDFSSVSALFHEQGMFSNKIRLNGQLLSGAVSALIPSISFLTLRAYLSEGKDLAATSHYLSEMLDNSPHHNGGCEILNQLEAAVLSSSQVAFGVVEFPHIGVGHSGGLNLQSLV